MRIVSLISSATEIVHALGLGAHQVGRSHECDYPESVKSLPVCTSPKFAVNGDSREIDRLVKETLADSVSVYDVFNDVLEALSPTHILTQTQCKVCAVSLEDVERALSASFSTRPNVVALEPNSLADVWNDIHRVARACRVPERGEELISALQERMELIRSTASAAGQRPRVACIEWQEPLMAAGNWTPELIEMAGGVDLFGKPGHHSPPIEFSDLVAADPDVIIVAPCGYDIARATAEMHWLTRRPEWPMLPAVRNRRVYVADGNQYFNRPGPRLVETLRIMAEILHPGHFNATLEGAGWKRIE